MKERENSVKPVCLLCACLQVSIHQKRTLDLFPTFTIHPLSKTDVA